MCVKYKPIIIGPLPCWKHLRIYDKGALNGLVSIVYCLCLMVVHRGNRGIFHDFETSNFAKVLFQLLSPPPPSTFWLTCQIITFIWQPVKCEAVTKCGRGEGGDQWQWRGPWDNVPVSRYITTLSGAWSLCSHEGRCLVLAGVGVNYDCLFWCCLANYPDHLHNEDVDNVMFAEHIILEYTF